jgi:hypothetical protein
LKKIRQRSSNEPEKEEKIGTKLLDVAKVTYGGRKVGTKRNQFKILLFIIQKIQNTALATQLEQSG